MAYATITFICSRDIGVVPAGNALNANYQFDLGQVRMRDIQSNLGCRNSCSSKRGMVSRSSLLYARQWRMVSIAEGMTVTAIFAGSAD
jgi:hypothetical protein